MRGSLNNPEIVQREFRVNFFKPTNNFAFYLGGAFVARNRVHMNYGNAVELFFKLALQIIYAVVRG